MIVCSMLQVVREHARGVAAVGPQLDGGPVPRLAKEVLSLVVLFVLLLHF